jgi:hypothetical protein
MYPTHTCLLFLSYNQPKRRKNKENKKENQNQKPFHESGFPDEFILKEAKKKRKGRTRKNSE